MAGLPGYNGASSFTGGLDCGPLALEVPMAGEHVAAIQGAGTGKLPNPSHGDDGPSSDGDIEVFRRARCLEAAVWLGLKPRHIFGLGDALYTAHDEDYLGFHSLTHYGCACCSIVADAWRQPPTCPSSSALSRLDQGTRASPASE